MSLLCYLCGSNERDWARLKKSAEVYFAHIETIIELAKEANVFAHEYNETAET